MAEHEQNNERLVLAEDPLRRATDKFLVLYALAEEGWPVTQEQLGGLLTPFL